MHDPVDLIGLWFFAGIMAVFICWLVFKKPEPVWLMRPRWAVLYLIVGGPISLTTVVGFIFLAVANRV